MAVVTTPSVSGWITVQRDAPASAAASETAAQHATSTPTTFCTVIIVLSWEGSNKAVRAWFI